MKTKTYSTIIKDHNGFSERTLTWRNTNKLLKNGFEGIKTGITDTAGPCLAACIHLKKNNHFNIKID